MEKELSRTKNELETQCRLNENKINKLKNRIKILENTTIKRKFATIGVISFAVMTMGIVLNGIIAPNLAANYGINAAGLFKGICICSLASGFILEKIIAGINNEKLNSFSPAKTEREKREEIIGYELEIEKLQNKNCALERAYQYVSDIESNLSVCKPDFGSTNMTEEEQLENNKKLKEEIETKENELDVLSTQAFLNREFCDEFSKFGKLSSFFNIILSGESALVASLALSLFFTPIMYMEEASASFLMKTIIFSSFTLGCSVSTIAKYLRRRENKEIFDKMNSKLGNNKLPESTSNYGNELDIIIAKGDSKISEISRAHLLYQDSSRQLEKFKDDKTIVESVSENHENYLDDNYEMILEPTLDEENHREVEGPTLVKKKSRIK